MDISVSSTKKGLLQTLLESLKTFSERRWLIWYLVRRQIAQDYRGSVLGIVWIFLGPMLMIVLYTLVFSEIIGLKFRQTESVTNFGLYLYCGLIPFMTYSDTVNQAIRSIRKNSSLVQRIIFPLEILPLTICSTAVLSQVFGFGALMVFVAVLERQLYWTALLIPAVMVLQLIFSLGLGYVGAVIGTYMPDVQETVRAVVRASFFVTPILWPVERVEGRPYLSLIVDLNPIAYLVSTYRGLVLEGQLPGMMSTIFFTTFAVVLCVAGFVLFSSLKKRFADLI